MRILLAVYFLVASAVSPLLCCCLVNGGCCTQIAKSDCDTCCPTGGCCSKECPAKPAPTKPAPCRCCCRAEQPAAIVNIGERFQPAGEVVAVIDFAPAFMPKPVLAFANRVEDPFAVHVRQRLALLCTLRC